jgi:hypothetical protein
VTQFLRLRHDRKAHEVICGLGTMNIIISSITVVIMSATLYCVWTSRPIRYVNIESEMWIYASMVSELEGEDKSNQRHPKVFVVRGS